MTVLTRAKTTGMSRKTGLGIHYSRIFGRRWSTVEKWTRSRLNPWLKLAFEIPRQAGASLLLASLSFFFAFGVVYLALFYAQFFCVLPYDHSMRCNCLSRRSFVYRKTAE